MYSRSNGFGRPFHRYQVLSWCVACVQVLSFYILCLPALGTDALFASFGLYTISIAVVGYSGFRVTYIDPTDQAVLDERACLASGAEFDSEPYTKRCRVCDAHVHDNSKHCGRCNRCVQEFDHHCKWLNNCIGRKNYRQFILLILSYEAVCTQQSAVGSYILSELLSDDANGCRDRLESNLGLSSDGYYIYQTLMFCVTIVSGLIAIAILNLIAFHVLLKFKGMTTFEYMVQNGRKVAPSTNELVSQSFNGLNDSTKLGPSIALPEPEILQTAKHVNM